MRNGYEIITVYDKDCGEVIEFCTDEIMNDSNDIVTYAIDKGLFEERFRKRIRWARAINIGDYSL